MLPQTAIASVFLACACGLARAQTPNVIISELMASNDSLRDQDRELPDWIELHNSGSQTVDIGGWHLSDSQKNILKWTFPKPTTIPAGGFLVVFASGKNRAVSGKELHTNFSLKANGEFLGLFGPRGSTLSTLFAPSYPRQFTGVSYGYAFNPGLTKNLVYFPVPTPRAKNNAGGSVIGEVTHAPAQPRNTDPIVVEAKLAHIPGNKTASVAMHYRVAYGAESNLKMLDDGVAPDRKAGDDVWTATIPRGTAPGNMMRWRVTAKLSNQASIRAPLYRSATNSPEYFGTMIQNPKVASKLPVLHWFVRNPAAARTAAGTRCSVYFDGKFYDNVHVRRRGGSSLGWTKRHYKFDFNTRHHFFFDPKEAPVEEFNLNSCWSDKAYIRQVLAFETYRDVGAQYSVARPWRVQQNGAFFSVAIFIEQPDEDYLVRQGLDPRGALYKMFNTLIYSTRSVEKKTRRWEGNADLTALVAGVRLSGRPLEQYLFDNIDVPAIISYLVAVVLIHDNDHPHKNHYLYRDTEGDGEWRFLPWDRDLTFGRNYLRSGGVLNDTIYANRDPYGHPLICDRQHPNTDNHWNRLIDAFHRTPRLRSMFLRRLRTVMDRFLQPPGTPRSRRHFERRMDELQAQMSADVLLDKNKWGIPAYGNTTYDFTKALSRIELEYLWPRRKHLFETHSSSSTGIIPARQPTTPALRFGHIDAAPTSGNQGEEYIEIVNCSNFAADLSGWRLSGAVEFKFEPGTVVLRGEAIYVSPNLPAFRARRVGPSGKQGRLVVGPYSGRLEPDSAIVLLDDRDQRIDAKEGFAYSLTTRGTGDLNLAVTRVPAGTELFILFSLETTRPVGCGPILGLGVDTLIGVGLPLGSEPFHVRADAAGAYRFAMPAHSLPKGLVADSRVAYFDPVRQRIAMSQIVRIRF